MHRRWLTTLAAGVLVLQVPACGESVLETNSGPWIAGWIQVNFLATDDGGVWDADDLTGIGFEQSITESDWVLTDDFGNGCALTFSYTMRNGNRFSRQAIRAGSRCPQGLSLSSFSDSGRFEFSTDGRFMIEWYDLQPGDEIVAFKFIRR